MCVNWKKTTVLVICIHKRVLSIVIAVSIKFGDESDLAILSFYNCPYKHNTFQKATCIFFQCTSIYFNLILKYSWKSQN